LYHGDRKIAQHRLSCGYKRTNKAVKQYHLREGTFIGQYKSIKEASIRTGCSKTYISQVCSGLLESTKGFVFKYVDKDTLNRPVTKCPKKVDLIDETGNIIETYQSVRTAAAVLKITCDSIYSILSRKAKKTRDGYRFQYH
jgi:hypothetical protein